MLIYTGVGSRSTPTPYLDLMKDYALFLKDKAILRSGGANGADTIFEEFSNNKEIYLPSYTFNGRVSDGKNYIYDKTQLFKALHLLEQYYLGFRSPKQYIMLLHARNIFQVLGLHFNKPSDFLICYTPDGLENLNYTKHSGGTRTAIFVAYKHNIPIYNIKNSNSQYRLELFLSGL